MSKELARFVHLQPLAINRRLAETRMSYAPDAPGTHLVTQRCHLQLATAAGGGGGGGRKRTEADEPDERPCWQFFMHLTIDATTTTRTLPCPVLPVLSWHDCIHPSIHPSIHSTAQRLVRWLIHALRYSFSCSFAHSFIHTACQLALLRLGLVRHLLG